MNRLQSTLIPLALALPGLPTVAATDANGLFISHLENILGTSFDLKVVAPSYTIARQAETAALAEISRLNAVLSSYQPDSEFSNWVSTSGEAVPVSADLLTVLAGFDHWRAQTGGAINAAAEAINQLWQRAARSETVPSETDRTDAVSAVQQQHWQLDTEAQTATHLINTPLRLHTFAKSYIMNQAANQALAVPGVAGVVVNIGGDLVVRGNRTESVALADPRADAENESPLARLAIQDRAVATSGNYRRGVLVDGVWQSHIVDPRTGNPAREVISTTVVHPDASTAGALATAFNVLTPADSAKLAASLPGTDYLIVTREGQQFTSPGWSQLVQPELTTASASVTATARNTGPTARLMTVSPLKDKLWNADQELLISVELSQIEGRSHRPFVAIWIEDEKHVPVRQIALWYNKPRWLRELRDWNNTQQNSTFDATSIASATRSPGSYTLKWDGKNDQGQYVKQGKYTICIEAAREHGTHQFMEQTMDFTGKFKQQPLNGNVEIANAALDYRKTGVGR
jgi:thiamine biosynthesis lipoprotein